MLDYLQKIASIISYCNAVRFGRLNIYVLRNLIQNVGHTAMVNAKHRHRQKNEEK